ncbi:MAG: hypothetical protein U0263_23670 [Polyangiaceae bacterium]
MTRAARVVLPLALALGGCGAGAKTSAPGPATPESSAEPASMGSPAGGAEGGDDGQAEKRPEQAPTGGLDYAEPPARSISDAEALFDSDSAELASALSTQKDCTLAKKALESMKRSADRICDLNGGDDPAGRCARAKQRLETAREQVRRSCGS